MPPLQIGRIATDDIHAQNAKSMNGRACKICSSHRLIDKSNRLLSQQLSVWWKASANIVVILILTYEATNISKG